MGIILDLLKEIPLSVMLRERLVELEKKITSLESQVSQLQSGLEWEQKEKNRYKNALDEHTMLQGKLEPKSHDD